MRKYSRYILFLLISALIFSGVAFYNGYPLIASDSCGYINQGFGEFIGQFRLFIYGFFVRHVSLAESLWFVVLAQGLILTYVLYRFIKVFFNPVPNYLVIIGIFIFLAAFTGVSWYCSQIMTDIFAGIAFLIMAVLLFKQEKSVWRLCVLLLLFLFSLQTHKSHYLVFTITIVIIGIIGWRSKLFEKRIFKFNQYIILFGVIIFNWLLTPIINYCVEDDFKMQSRSHIYFSGRLIETGMLERVLDDVCKEKDYFLCEYKDSLPYSKSKFLWSAESPLNKTGGWNSHKNEYRKIIYESFKKPRFLLIHISDFLKTTVRQLIRTDVGKLLYSQKKHKNCLIPIKKYFHYEYPQFITSRQNKGKLQFEKINNRRFYILLLSIFIVLYVLSKHVNRRDKTLFFLSMVFITFLIVNAAFTGPIAGISKRYQGRIIWLLPFLAILLINNYWSFFKGKPNHKKNL